MPAASREHSRNSVRKALSIFGNHYAVREGNTGRSGRRYAKFSVFLQIWILIGGGNPCIADALTPTSLSQNSARTSRFETLISRQQLLCRFASPARIIR
jgi:hypothetical protein